jgi:cold shock CspA family protein
MARLNRWRPHPRIGAPIFQPASAQHEGVIKQSGFRPDGEGGYCFARDIKEGRDYFIHIHDCGEATFRQLRPGMRIAFEVFERRDGKTGAHRVSILG